MLNKYKRAAVCLEIAQNNEFPQLLFRRPALQARRRYRAAALHMAKRTPKLTLRPPRGGRTQQPIGATQFRDFGEDHSVEDRKVPTLKKSNHRCTRSLSCRSLARNFSRQRFEQNWFLNPRCRMRPTCHRNMRIVCALSLMRRSILARIRPHMRLDRTFDWISRPTVFLRMGSRVM
jgi:hypothetical protein